MGKFKEFLVGLLVFIGSPIILLIVLISSRMSKKTVKIAILGGQACGKTELWSQLKGEKNKGMATSQEEVEEFVLGKNADGKDVTVVTSQDFGGGDRWVRNYENVINDNGVFVFFLIDLQNIKRDKENIRERLRKIASIIEKNNYKDCGLYIIGTFFDKYRGEEKQAIEEIKKVIVDEKIKGIDRFNNIRVLNTTNKNDVEKIRIEILDSIK